VFTRRSNDWTNRFRKIAADACNAGSAIIDGEVVVPAEDGTTDFAVLQNELKGRSKKIVMFAFDLLYLNGYDLRKLPLFERKALLNKIIAETDIQISEGFEVDGAEMYKHACKTGLEGVVSKVRNSRYVSGRINDWVKKTSPSARRWPSPASRSMATSGTAFISPGRRAKRWSTPVRSTTGLTPHRPKICRRGSSR
jgi:bifunctional non-homologous end joining protein LigD